jgi:outer membrane protein assembly factor BamD (BamD/ComL family)
MAQALTPADLFARAQATENPRERIALFEQVLREYPADKSATQAAFMIGFTYAEEMKDFLGARKAFESFVSKYPHSDLVASAKWMIENMEHGVPPPSVGMPDTLYFKNGPGAPPGGTNSRP